MKSFLIIRDRAMISTLFEKTSATSAVSASSSSSSPSQPSQITRSAACTACRTMLSRRASARMRFSMLIGFSLVVLMAVSTILHLSIGGVKAGHAAARAGDAFAVGERALRIHLHKIGVWQIGGAQAVQGNEMPRHQPCAPAHAHFYLFAFQLDHFLDQRADVRVVIVQRLAAGAHCFFAHARNYSA